MTTLAEIDSDFGTFFIEITPAGSYSQYTASIQSLIITGPNSWSSQILVAQPAATGEFSGCLLQCDAGERLGQAISIVNNRIQELANRRTSDILFSMLDRASDPEKGIFTAKACNICPDDRALLLSALNDSGMTGKLLTERANPTPPSDLFGPGS